MQQRQDLSTRSLRKDGEENQSGDGAVPSRVVVSEQPGSTVVFELVGEKTLQSFVSCSAWDQAIHPTARQPQILESFINRKL